MPTLTLKNIPDPLYQQLKASARRHHRSMNGELLFCLEQRYSPQAISPEERIQRFRRLRPDLPADAVTVDEIQQAIASGRP